MSASSGSDQKYYRSNFVPQGNVLYNGKTVSIPDTFDWNYQKMLATLLPIFTASKLEGVPLTSISYELYNNTSVFWAILAANGYFHPLALLSGTPVGYPDISNVLTSKTGSSNTSNNTNSTLVTI